MFAQNSCTNSQDATKKTWVEIVDVTCHIFPAPFFVIDVDSDYNRTFLSGVSDTVYWIRFYADSFRNTRFGHCALKSILHGYFSKIVARKRQDARKKGRNLDVTCHIFPAPFFVIDVDSDYNRTFLSGVSDTVYWIRFFAESFRNTRFYRGYDVTCHIFPALFFVIDADSDYNRTFWAKFRTLCVLKLILRGYFKRQETQLK